MRRRALLGLALAAALPVRAQRRKLPKVGYLLLTALSEPPTRDRQAFLDG